MLCFFCSASTNNIFVVLSVYFALLLPEIGYCRLLTNVYNPFLDIALLYDQSKTMKNHKNSSIWEDFGSWIDNYFAGQKREADKTRFAVMGCGSTFEHNGTVDPVLYFNGNITPGTISAGATPKETVMNAHKYVQDKIDELWDNVDGCSRSTLEKLFIEDKGDRPDASNVVFYISDCLLFETTSFHVQIVSKLLSKSAAFLFVCLKKPADEYYENMKLWVIKDSLIFVFTDKETLQAKLDEVLPKTDLEVEDCVWKGWNQTGCVNKNNGGYYNIQFPNIIVEMTYPMYGDNRIACPTSTNITCEKDEFKCDTDFPWKVFCCNGALIKRRKSKGACEKKVITTLADCNETCPADEGDEEGEEGKNKESSDSTTIIIGAVIGGVLLILILVIVIVALVVRSKRNKGKKGKQGKGTGVGKHASVKDRTLKADLNTVMGTSKMVGGRSKFGGKSKIEKSTAGGKGKGAKSTTRSKPSESETSSQKSKPTLSKPSESKPTSSKPSKSKPTSSKPSKSKSSKK